MKVGKNQPSMIDALRAVPARGGHKQSPKTINASVSCQERSSVNTLTGSESNNIIQSSTEGGGCVTTQTGLESNNVIQSSPERSRSRSEDQIGAEDSLKTISNQSGSVEIETSSRSQPPSLVPGKSAGPVPGHTEHMGTDSDFAFGARSGWKSSQGGTNSEVSEPVCQVLRSVSEYSKCEDRILPSMSVAQLRVSVDQPNVAKCEDRILPSMSVAQPRVSVDQPSIAKMRCQDARVDGETSGGQYVCTVCTMQHEVCGGAERCYIGQASTNQNSRKRYSVNITNAKGGTTILGREGTTVSGTVKTPSSSFGNRISKQKGGGTRMKTPAMFSSNTTPVKKDYTHFNGDGATLTPTKRKLVSNCNTRTLLRIFENAAGKPPTVDRELGEIESPAKKRRCEDIKRSTNLTKPGD